MYPYLSPEASTEPPGERLSARADRQLQRKRRQAARIADVRDERDNLEAQLRENRFLPVELRNAILGYYEDLLLNLQYA